MEIRPVSATETYPIRQSVLRPGQPIEASRFPGDDASLALHLGAFEDGKLVSIASFFAEPHPEVVARAPYRLRGMATLPEYRGRGHGSALVREGLRLLAARQADVLWFNARVGALGFYEKLGFRRQGEEFDIPGIGPHYVMTGSIVR